MWTKSGATDCCLYNNKTIDYISIDYNFLNVFLFLFWSIFFPACCCCSISITFSAYSLMLKYSKNARIRIHFIVPYVCLCRFFLLLLMLSILCSSFVRNFFLSYFFVSLLDSNICYCCCTQIGYVAAFKSAFWLFVRQYSKWCGVLFFHLLYFNSFFFIFLFCYNFFWNIALVSFVLLDSFLYIHNVVLLSQVFLLSIIFFSHLLSNRKISRICLFSFLRLFVVKNKHNIINGITKDIAREWRAQHKPVNIQPIHSKK